MLGTVLARTGLLGAEGCVDPGWCTCTKLPSDAAVPVPLTPVPVLAPVRLLVSVASEAVEVPYGWGMVMYPLALGEGCER